MEIYSESLTQIFGQFSFVSAVLAGFAVTLYIELLSLNTKKLLWKVSTTFALLAATLFIISTISSVFATVRIANYFGAIEEVFSTRLKSTLQWSIVMILMGLVSFIISLGSCGWTRSRTMGIISTLIASLGLIVIFYIFFGVLGFS